MLSVRWLIHSDMDYIRPLLSEIGMDEDDFINLLRQRDTIGLVAVDATNLRKHHAFAAYRLHRDRFEIVCMNGTIPGLEAIVHSLKNKLSCHRRRRVVMSIPEHDLVHQLFLSARGFYGVSVGESILFDYTLQQDDCCTL